MAAPSHYPLSLGRIFGLGWSLFRYAWRPIIGATAICLVPFYLVAIVVSAAFSPTVNSWLTAAQLAQLRGQAPPPLPAGFEVAFISLFAIGLLSLLATLLAIAAIVRIVDASYRSQPIGAIAAVRDGAGRLLSLIAGQLLVFLTLLLIVIGGVVVGGTLVAGGGILVFFGLIVFVAVFAAIVFVLMRSALLAQAIVIERIGGAEGFRRSWGLTVGSGWRVIGYLLLIGLIVGLLDLALALLPALVMGLTETSSTDVALATGIQGVSALLTSWILPVLLTFLYYDLRWRRGETVPVPGGGETSQGQSVPPTPFGPPPL